MCINSNANAKFVGFKDDILGDCHIKFSYHDIYKMETGYLFETNYGAKFTVVIKDSLFNSAADQIIYWFCLTRHGLQFIDDLDNISPEIIEDEEPEWSPDLIPDIWR